MSESGTVRRLIQPNRRILIVDDNRSIHEDFHKILSGNGADRGDIVVALKELVANFEGRLHTGGRA